jgi:hypothetical protein
MVVTLNLGKARRSRTRGIGFVDLPIALTC